MAEPMGVVDLHIKQDLSHERLEWRIERAAWLCMSLPLLAALAGFLGPGPFSVTRGAGELLQVEYNRFTRYHAPESLNVQVNSGAIRDGQVRLSISGDFVRSIDLQRIHPQPVKIEASSRGNTYIFAVPDAEGPVTVRFDFEPRELGRIAGGIGVAERPQLTFAQFVYP